MDGGGRSPSGRSPGYGFSKRYSADDLARLAHANANRQHAAMRTMGMVGKMDGVHSLDEIVSQNNREQQRRRSLQQGYLDVGPSGNDVSGNTIDFNATGPGDLDGYSIGAADMPPSPHGLSNGGHMASQEDKKNAGLHGTPGRGMTMDTPMDDFAIFGDAMDTDPRNPDLRGQFLDMPMDTGYDERMDPMLQHNMAMFGQNNFGPTVHSPMDNHGVRSGQNHQPDPSGLTADSFYNMPSVQPSSHSSLGQAPNGGMLHGVSPGSGMMPSAANASTTGFGSQVPGVSNFAQPTGLPDHQPKVTSPYAKAYSQSGFDMLGILMRVAARPKPQINIGAVDMSCAFVVCDVSQHDIPIVYVSEMFERLTGYVKHETLGRNCRFLQAPDGKVQSGHPRKYADDKSVYYLRHMVLERQEAQISMINYRKGGQPFMNLLTIIPITWDTDEIRYYVGFQVDLVEQPTSITNKNPGTDPP